VRHVDWNDTQGTIELSVGRWTMHAAANTLTLRVEAASEGDLKRIQSLVGGRLEQIGRRDRLTVGWERVNAPSAAPVGSEATRSRRRRFPLVTVVLVGLAVVFVGVHLALGGAALAVTSWSVWTAAGIGAVVLVKVVAVGLLARRRHNLGGVARHLVSRVGHRRVPHDGGQGQSSETR
jgi:hypothetical protein